MEQTEVVALAEGTVASRPGLFRADQIRMTAATGSGAAAAIRLRQRSAPARWELPQIGVPGQHAGVLSGVDVDPVTGRLLTIAELVAQFAATQAACPQQPQQPRQPQGGSADPDPRRRQASAAPASWLGVVSAQPGAGCTALSRALGSIDQDGAGPSSILDGGSGWAFDWRWYAQRPPSAIVVTCRASVPGVIETERLLTYLDGQPGMTDTIMLVAALGTVEWPRAVRSACGPLVSATRAAGCVVAVPYLREMEAAGRRAVPAMVAELSGPAATTAEAVLPDDLVTVAQEIWALNAAGQHAT